MVAEDFRGHQKGGRRLSGEVRGQVPSTWTGEDFLRELLKSRKVAQLCATLRLRLPSSDVIKSEAFREA
jgi:hypothetical protein